MPRLPSYRLHKSTGQAVVSLSGRDVYLGQHGTEASREKYDRVVQEWLAAGRQRAAHPSELFTVTELISSYFRFAKDYYRKNGLPTTEVAKIKASMRPLRRAYGRTSAAEFGPLALQAVRESLVTGGYTRRANGPVQRYTRRHINQSIDRIKRMFRWGVERELVPACTYEGLRCVAGLKRGRSEAREAEPVRPIAEAHIVAAMKEMPSRIRAMCELQLLTGMRAGEVRIMRGCDVDTTAKL